MHTLFVSHGGGPLPLLDDPGHRDLVASFAELAPRLPQKPSVIVVVSAHWEEAQITVNSGAAPDMLYDYYGFPEPSYQLQYPAPGAPELAERVAAQLSALGLPVANNRHRGFDHGVFIPLMLLYPEADIPVLQISLHKSLQPEIHWRLGQALAQALPEDALLLGSGFSFHNMPLFFQPLTSELENKLEGFNGWLDHLVCDAGLVAAEREQGWLGWAEAPAARLSHPREEHLIPLLVCAAANRTPAEKIEVDVLNVNARHYLWV